MKNLLLFVLGCLPALVWGQFGPQNVIVGCEVCSPYDVHSADLDGDGDSDILSASYFDSKITWYENDGNGNFSEQRIISLDTRAAASVYTADLDNDGDLDVLSASIGDNKIAWYENDGSGNFSEQRIISIRANGALAVYAADLDNDGDLDVLSASSRDNEVAWYENDGNGNFSEERIIAAQATFVQDVYAADLDNDGDLDVLSAVAGDNKIAWYENDGVGNFSEEQIIATRIYSLTSIYAADLDNDGDIDILSPSSINVGIVWYKNDGAGNFSEQQIISTNPVVVIYATDLDKDGDLDILSANHNEIAWYENDGVGNFSEQRIISTNMFGGKAVYTADLDNDGDIDILSASEYDDKIAWYENDGDNNFSEHQLTYSGANSAKAVYAADLDNDGDLDVLSASYLDAKVAWYENDGVGNFSEQQIISTQANRANSVYVADLDNDEDLDVISAFSARDDEIAWYENDGVGNFSEERIISSQEFDAKAVHAADLDNDGNIDVFFASFRNNKVGWCKNEGNGIFSELRIIHEQFSGSLSAVYAADIDNDGDIDILSTADSSGKVLWFENDGIGNFSEQRIISNQAFNARGIYAADIDNDGNIDVLSASSADDKIAWYKNDGVGNFSEQKIISTEIFHPNNVYAADIDNDGDADVFATSYVESKVAWFENDGNGNFSAQRIISTEAIGAESAYAADLDNDGDLDMLSASLGDDKIAWYENLTNNPYIQGITFWDENGDGVLNEGEHQLNGIDIAIAPEEIAAYSTEGEFKFYVSDGTYSITVQPNDCWQLTTDSTSYTVTINENTIRDLNFGFQLASDYQHTQARINSNATRCGFEVPFTLSVENDGCVSSRGQYGIVLDDLVTLLSTEVEPSEVRGDTLLWNYEELIASQHDRIHLTLEIAGVDNLGDIIQLTGLSYIEKEQGGLELSSTYDYTSEIRCAYDPNDKLVYPNRSDEYDANYTLFGEELEYTVRFQNTGNDTAFTVIIRDELDMNLDWTSFKPILASHPYETLLHANGLVEFTFRDILLPDSTTNEPLSHGFVSYRISPKAGLDENTNIENTANIFFDFNPPIKTNTTQNVLVSELPKMTSTKEPKTSQKVAVYPNPFEEVITFQLEQAGIYQVQFLDVTGRLVQEENIQGMIQEIATQQLANGLYFYQIKNDAGVLLANGKLVKSSR